MIQIKGLNEPSVVHNILGYILEKTDGVIVA